jgi:serine/threonine protein kinase
VINRTIGANEDARGHIVTLLDNFRHVGPNGEHECLVFEPMGPDVAARFGRSIPYRQGRLICKQLLLALQCLHDLGYAHCDTNPGNMMLSLTHPIENLSGEGRSMSMQIDGKRDPCAPRYIHEDWPLTEFCDYMAPVEVKLSDFGAGTYSLSSLEPTVLKVGSVPAR